MHYAIQPTLTPEGNTLRYITESSGSTFVVKAFAGGLLSAFAHNLTIAIPDFEGEIFLNPDAVERSSLRLVVHSHSLMVTDEVNEKDREEITRRMYHEVLESDSSPSIVYETLRTSGSKLGQQQYWFALNGELTLRGVTRGQVVTARVSLNDNTLRADGEFAVRMSDYGIRPVTAAGGTIRLKDELKLSFSISARQRE